MDDKMHCSKCNKKIEDVDHLYHTTIESFDKLNPQLCTKCEMELVLAIESFIKDVIDK